MPHRLQPVSRRKGLYPTSDATIHGDHSVFEEQTKTSAASLIRKNYGYQLILAQLLLVIAFLSLEVFLQTNFLSILYMLLLRRALPDRYGPQAEVQVHRYLARGLLCVSVTTLGLFFLSGVSSEKIAHVNKSSVSYMQQDSDECDSDDTSQAQGIYSPIAMKPMSPLRSMFTKKSSFASYLSAVSYADTRARAYGKTPGSTPVLSSSSSMTSASEDTVLHENEDNEDGLSYANVYPTSEQTFTTVHTEFGHCSNDAFRHTSQYNHAHPIKGVVEQDPPYYILLSTYMSLIQLTIFGHLRDFFGKRFKRESYKHLRAQDGYAPLNSDFDSFYTRRFKLRIDDCFSHPVTGVPGRTIVLLDRYSPDHNNTMISTGTRTRALNVSSYNYLGFAQGKGACAEAVVESVERYGLSACGTRLEGGTLDLHVQAESIVSRFLGMEATLVSSMGFATNSTIIPALVGKGCLVISDELNHASIRVGIRLSGANVRTFKHNNMKSLASLLREVISQGQPKSHRAWKKILVIVEGLYSMEGTLVNLPAIIELKKKYKFYLFVDEAHSVGALGPHGRGVTDYYGVNPRSVDILMGTFTKSFGAAGGYVSGNKSLIDRLRICGHSGTYTEAMAPPVLTQVIASMASIMGITLPQKHSPSSRSSLHNSENAALGIEYESYPGRVPAAALPSWMTLTPSMCDGSDSRMRLRRLAFNTRYLNRALRKLGFITYGHDDSPVVPLLLFHLGKMATFSRLMRTRATPIIVVVVSYPATPLVTSRVRFCMSASHTKEDVDTVLKACDEIGELLDLKQAEGERWPLQEIMDRAVELVNMDEVL